jgi:copper(I)-binding protein
MVRWVLALSAALMAAPALAQVEVGGAWVRATVPGQLGTGAFMTLTSRDGARIVGADSPVAGVVEVHEMKMEGGVMTMRAIDALELPAGKSVELKPGGYHVMLLDLKRPLKAGEKVPLSLRIETHDGKVVTVPVEAEVGVGMPMRGVGRKK